MKRSVRMVSLAEDYLASRRRLGFDLKSTGRRLLDFACFADRSGHQGPLTVNLAASWARSGPGQAPFTWARRIEIVRPFARYLQQFDPATEVPPLYLFGRAHRRLTPHIYADEEIRELLGAALTLPSKEKLRPVTYSTLFGLIAATGLRISEALNLRRADVDLDHGLLMIRETKYRKSRVVPLHLTVVRALARYVKLRDRDWPITLSDHFFIVHGSSMKISTVEDVFGSLRSQLGWVARGDHPAPRIHDLRHSFICRRVLLWYQQGVDVDNAMVMLSTYVGHAKVTDTYWYLTGIPELMAIAAQRFEHFTEGVCHV
jgi:integrase